MGSAAVEYSKYRASPAQSSKRPSKPCSATLVTGAAIVGSSTSNSSKAAMSGMSVPFVNNPDSPSGRSQVTHWPPLSNRAKLRVVHHRLPGLPVPDGHASRLQTGDQVVGGREGHDAQRSAARGGSGQAAGQQPPPQRAP